MNKSILTNLVGLALIAIGYFNSAHMAGKQLFTVGLFALSGSLTNWLAVHMLFEKVPLLYGSGVIPNRFEQFKSAIKELIMGQFFTEENIDRFFHDQANSPRPNLDFGPLIEKLDYDFLFNKLVEAVMESPMGGMLGMMGGTAALDPIKAPFKVKAQTALVEMTNSPEFTENLESLILGPKMSSEVSKKIEDIVDARLNELTPKMVKEIVQQMIKEHLGWLVVWGGVFGGLIGLGMSFIQI